MHMPFRHSACSHDGVPSGQVVQAWELTQSSAVRHAGGTSGTQIPAQLPFAAGSQASPAALEHT
jgi:hypothetical protein